MRKKIGIGTVVILMGTIICSVMGGLDLKEGREIRTAKNFLETLDKYEMIAMQEADSLKISKTKVNKGEQLKNVIVANKIYTVEINEKLEVIGFTSKDCTNTKKISYEEAVRLGEGYVNILGKDQYKFVEEEKKIEEEVPYYTLKFEKYKDGYPCYGMDVIVNVDKGNGKVVGYINRIGKARVEKGKIKVGKDEAVEIAKKELSEFNKEIVLEKEPKLYYYRKNKESEKASLVYVINLDSQNGAVREKYIYFINSKTGEITNKLRDLLDESIKKGG